MNFRCTCQPPSDEWFDHVLCGCGEMHTYCECGGHTDHCDLYDPSTWEVTPGQSEGALEVALDEAGLTLDELLEQAESGRFPNLEQRMAWHVYLAVRDPR